MDRYETKEKAIAAAKKIFPVEQFHPHELLWYTVRDRKSNLWTATPHPTLGGRLRLAHQDLEHIRKSDPTATLEILPAVEWTSDDGTLIRIRAVVTTPKGTFAASNTGSILPDADAAKYAKKETEIEKVESGAISRALRLAGYGVELAVDLTDELEEHETVPEVENPGEASPGNGYGERNGDTNVANGTKHNEAIEHFQNFAEEAGFTIDQATYIAFRMRYVEGKEEQDAPVEMNLDRLEPDEIGRLGEWLAGIANPKHVLHWRTRLECLYPRQIIDGVCKGLEIENLREIKRNTHKLEEFLDVLGDIQTNTDATDYQTDMIRQFIAATDWKGEDDPDCIKWMQKKISKDAVETFADAQIIIGAFMSTCKEAGHKIPELVLSDYDSDHNLIINF